MASETFPRVVGALDLDAYHDEVAAGLVLSVGGLTEAVVKSSAAALLDWARKAPRGSPPVPAGAGGGGAGGLRGVERLAVSLLGLLGAPDDRVTLPTMKTLELLLGAGLLDDICTRPAPLAALGGAGDAGAAGAAGAAGESLGAALMGTVTRDLARSANIAKLFTGLNLALALLHLPRQTAAMRLVLELLAHRYPRVRKYAAEQFYTKLLVDERLVDAEVYELVLDQLSATVWDADIGAVRADRDNIAAAVQVTPAMLSHLIAPSMRRF